MDYNELRRDISGGRIASLYLFTGAETYIRGQALQWLREALLPEGLEALNETMLDNPDADTLIASADTLPLLARRRLVVVRGLRLLITDQQVAGSKEQTEKLCDYFARVPDTVCLVIVADDKPDMRRKVVKTLAQHAADVRFDHLDEATLAAWISKEAKRRGGTIDRSAAAFLIYWSGGDMNTLSGEIGKLCAFVSGGAGISQTDVRALASRTRECSVFEWMDSLLEGRAGDAVAQLGVLCEQGETAIGLIALLGSQLRKLAMLRAMLDRREPMTYMLKKTKMKSYALERMTARARALPYETIRYGIDTLVETDEGIRSGRFAESDAIYRAALRIMAAAERSYSG